MNRNAERVISRAVATIRRWDYRLVADNRFGVTTDRRGWVPALDDQEVCICGAVALAENPTTRTGVIAAVARKLGITCAQAASLSDGFEDMEPGSSWAGRYTVDKAWYRIGRKWRQRADEVRN